MFKIWPRASQAGTQAAMLNSRNIYIIPTRWGLLYMVMLFAMLAGSINYTLSMGFAFTFLLASLANITMLHTWRNLLHCQVQFLRATPAFAGKNAMIEFTVADVKHRPRYAITATFKANAPDKKSTQATAMHIATTHNITASTMQVFHSALKTQTRGLHRIPRLTLCTEFPLSLFYAWSYVDLNHDYLVYPTPASNTDFQPSSIAFSSQSNAENTTTNHQGDEDFSGHRPYQLGDTPKQINWKASSRGLGLLTKQYESFSPSLIHFSWADTAHFNLNYEQRISLLTRWVIDANQRKQRYGLNLPRGNIAPSNGEMHYHTCLKALALMETA